MPTITVSGIIADGERVLLARPDGSDSWSLPGGLLTDADETVEDALVRALAECASVQATAHEFLDTLYERRPGEVVVHNVFLVTEVAGRLPPDGDHAGTELRWRAHHSLGDLPLVPWLAEVLPALVAGESAPRAQLDAGAFAAAVNAEFGSALAPGAARTPGQVFIVTGPAGAGKSTVARALCARFPRAAHVDVDLLRWRMVVSGYVRPEAAAGAGPEAAEARRQLDLATRNACALAWNFVSDGFDAVIDDVLERADDLDRYLQELQGLNVAFVTLLPDAETLRMRDRSRAPDDRMGERSAELRRIIAGNGETRGLRLDTSGWSVEETVDIILERLPAARVALAAGSEL